MLVGVVLGGGGKWEGGNEGEEAVRFEKRLVCSFAFM